MQHFEKLGAFYLGKKVDPDTMKRSSEYLLYDSKDMTTHAICVGMTGSGKTGLCVGVLEEAAIDGIPAIVIDPKGDMTNLMLSFPGLSSAEFEPWVNSEEAKKNGMDIKEYASAQAKTWTEGLAEWEQDGQRIHMMRQKTEFQVYTPGSTAGKPVSIVNLFSSPSEAILNDPESMNELASGTASSLLGLLGIDADPIKSREHILISNILLSAWRNKTGMDLPNLITNVQKPLFDKIGVMALDTFYPERERMTLSMQFNNLLASPGFYSWTQGEPLDIDSLLYTAEGRPKISILAISHLSEAERMFFVSLLLNKTVSWVRTQPGTSSLRALLYMDEIFGYFPPVSDPPSKGPLLTLLKQARAFGLGVMLTTQNPMDLDYKGMANMGTWFIGRLQTDRYRARLLDGLEGAFASSGRSFDRSDMEQLLSRLGKRVFLMNNVHDEEAVLFETRWCMSYLRGPLMRNEIQSLTAETGKVSVRDFVEAKPSYTKAQTFFVSKTHLSAVPELPSDVLQVYLPYRGANSGITYRASLTALTEVHFSDPKNGISDSTKSMRYTLIKDGMLPVDWNDSEVLDLTAEDLENSGTDGADYLPVNPECLKKSKYTEWEKELSDFLFRNSSLSLFRNDHLKKTSRPGESERDFRIRLDQESREERDEAIDKLRTAYSKKVFALEEKIRKAEQAVEREKDQAKDAGFQTAVSLGSTILGALLGSKKISVTSLSRAATTVKGVSRSVRQQGDVGRSKETVEIYKAQLEQIEADLQKDIEDITDRLGSKTGDIVTTELRPLKRDCLVKAMALTWEPVRKTRDGVYERAW